MGAGDGLPRYAGELACDLERSARLFGVAAPALAARAFSSLSALKKISSGDAFRRGSFFKEATETGCGHGEAVALSSELSSLVGFRLSRADAFGTDRENARGIGRADGAGEA